MLFLFFCVSVRAEEYIDYFHSDITVNQNATLTIREDITVYPKRISIRHGIYRDLPINNGEKYDIINVWRDGYPEPYRVFNTGGNKRIQIGDSKAYVPRERLTTYTIEYVAYNTGLKKFADKDEVYWNVTGNEWQFPINMVTAEIHLPNGANFIQQASYCGYLGSQTPANYDIKTNLFSASNLKLSEGLTVSVGFTKGVIAHSSPFFFQLSDDLTNALIMIFVPLIYLLIMWFWKGRDRFYYTPMPEFEAPQDITPVQALYYVQNGKPLSNQVAQIHFIEMVNNGFIQIERSKNTNTKIILTGKEATTEQEKKYQETFKKQIKLNGKYNSKLRSYILKYEQKQFDIYKKNHPQNRRWLFGGYVLFFALIFCFFTGENCIPASLAFIMLSLSGLIPFLRFFSYFLIVMFSGVIYMIGASSIVSLPYFFQVVVVFIMPLVILPYFKTLMISPTRKGAENMAKVAGLELFLTTLDIPTPKDFSLQNIKDLFPYAVAFGLQGKWMKRFENDIDSLLFESTIYDQRFQKSFSNKLFRAATSPSSGYSSSSSSSGSSGGGSSGGGGGGGGGGGW